MSIKIIKSCNKLVAIHLTITSKIKKGVFPAIWKYVVFVHEKEDRTLIKKYCLISLLLDFGKICDRVIYHSLFNISSVISFFTLFVLGLLRRLVRCLAIISNTWNAKYFWQQFFCWCEMCFHRNVPSIWQSLISLFHLWIKTIWCWDELLSLLKIYLHNCDQSVVLSSQTSDWSKINSEFPQV